MKGRYKITTLERGKVVKETGWIHNLIMQGVANGTGIVAKQLIADTTYPIAITSATIGTGSTAPAIGDTALQTPVLSDIIIPNFDS